jgi:hypothetical protein
MLLLHVACFDLTIRNEIKGKAWDTVEQKECECGARVAKYMEDLTHNYRQMGEKESISYMIGRSLKWEKEKGVNELAGCRNRIKKKN